MFQIKSPSLLLLAVTVFVGSVAVLQFGCATVRGPERLDGYRQALDASVASASGHLDAEAARQRFAAFYAEFTPEAVRRNVPEVFAPDAYLNDYLHEAHGREAVAAYLSQVAEDFVDASFVVEGVAHNDIDYYFRWTMSFRLRGNEDDPPLTSPGVSHVRFDAEGRILFEADHWDLNAVYERIPGVAAVVRKLRQ